MSKELRIEGNNVVPVIKALSNEVRLKILSMLADKPMNVQALARELGLSKTAVLGHVNLLEQAGFIQSEYKTGSLGSQRICHKIYERLVFDFDPLTHGDEDEDTYYETEIPVGNYFGFDAWAPCGLATHNHIVQKWDDPAVFCDIERVHSSLVWFAFGYLEYRIPLNALFNDKHITKVKINFEVSPHHMVKNHNALMLPPGITADRITEDITDVTIWVNGQEIGTETVSLGEDRETAIHTPAWWRTQPYHGELLKISLNEGGCFLNRRKTCELTGTQILAKQDGYLTLRIGIKPDAEHMNGIMLFGRDFGRYDKGIDVRFFISE